ncbi:MAG TPA: alpha-amylase family glycosyl hydrolase [Nannocystaceae bacterium]|nr:alpha-amylase family glycosyl hydrolase [Nannocystaceae bacterium]
MRRFAIVCGSLLAACSEQDELPPGTCPAVVWAIPDREGARVELSGEWADWHAQPMRAHVERPWVYAELALPPGEYGYAIVQAGEHGLDRYNGLGGFRTSDGAEVSWLVVDDCLAPGLAIGEDALRFVPSRDGDALERVELELDGAPIHDAVVDDDRVVLPKPSLPRGRHVLRATAIDRAGLRSPTREVAIWAEPVAETSADAIVYQVVIDRFRGDGGAVLDPPEDLGARAGGTLAGVRAEIDAGTFAELGVSTLWLSPVYTNPDELRPGRDDDHLYSAYHGYWPSDSRGVDPRIGGESELDALITAAHAQGLRVLFDLVPNHYDVTNPRVSGHEGEGWFNEREPVCICGASDCPWSSAIETCWFTDYLPDLRLQQRDALQAAIDDTLWWHGRFAIDGFRVDAVPMMPRAATRRIYHALRSQGYVRDDVLLLGEVFTGAGEGGVADLRYHLGPDGLDGAFDFPTMWALRDVLRDGPGFDALLEVLHGEDEALEGSGSVLARMLGNHDTTRIASAITGDDDGDPWASPPAQSDDPELFARLRVAFAAVLTLPGIPVIYYGDELGLAGARDPDSRRTMPDPATVSPVQRDLFAAVARLGRLRRCMPALRRGSWRALGATPDLLAFVREHDDAPAIVVLSRTSTPSTIAIPAAAPPGWYKDAMSELRVALDDTGATLELPAFATIVLIPESHACVDP